MDIFTTTVEIIKIINSIYELCDNYRETDATIRIIHLRLENVNTRLELFQEYFRRCKQSLTTRRAAALQRSLEHVGDLLQDLKGKLPPLSTVSAKLVWAGWGKRSVERILVQLKEWDEDVRGTIFALDVLSRIRDDQALYKRLFDTGERALTATWTLCTRIHASSIDDNLFKSLSIPLSSLSLPSPTDKRKMMATMKHQLVYVEVLYIERNGDEESQKWANARLATTFHSPLMPSMHLLTCQGIADDYDHDRAFLVYELPQGTFLNSSSHLPTLARALETQVRMSLEDRYRLAVEIVTAVLEIHAAGWVHKSIRSDTVLVDIVEQADRKEDVYIGPAFLVGFEAARPHTEGSDQRPEMDVAKRRYHHPERQGGRDSCVKKFDLRHDMYSLGTVLIELGYRKTLSDIYRGPKHLIQAPSPGEAEVNHKRLVNYAHRLSDKMGRKYADAVMTCLVKSTEVGKQLDDLRQEFYEDVLRPLSEIMNGFKPFHRTAQNFSLG